MPSDLVLGDALSTAWIGAPGWPLRTVFGAVLGILFDFQGVIPTENACSRFFGTN